MVQRFVITFVLIAAFLWLPYYGFVGGGISAAHFLYPLCHANIFHLAANLLCLWMLRCSLHIVPAYIIATAASFLPCFIMEPTSGISGVLFAIVGISWGRIGKFKEMARKCLPFIIICIFIPHVNAFIHLYCILLGYAYGLTGFNDPMARIDPYKK